jgi:hypothetical protein
MMKRMRSGSHGVAAAALLALSCSSSYSLAELDAGSLDAGTDAAHISHQMDAAVVVVDAGTVVDASPEASANPCGKDLVNDSTNCGVCGHVCNVGTCMASECQHVAFVAGPVPSAGDLGGINGADAICQTAASSAGLQGRFLAWLGTPTSAPKDRFFKANRPYVLRSGQVVAPTFADLLKVPLKAGIGVDAFGMPTGIGRNWSNVGPDGSYVPGDGNACSGWTSNIPAERGSWGNTGGTGTGWTNGGSDACNTSGHGIYCFEQ